MVDVYVMRHSHVDYREGIPMTEENPLTPLGHRIAGLLATRSIGWGLQHLFASTMTRAVQTVEAVRAANPGVEITWMDDLRESSVADLRGFPGTLPASDLRQWGPDHFDYANLATYARVREAWGSIQRATALEGWARVGIVAHGGSINMLLRVFLGLTNADLADCHFEFDWAAVTVLRYDERPDGRWRSILRVNDSAHLDALRGEIAAFDHGASAP